MKRTIIACCMLAALTMVATSCKKEKQDLGVEMAYGHEYVDLGLPSGTLWATCNVGATNPWDYGDYFAWGETQPYYDNTSTAASPTWTAKPSGYAWASYPFTSGSTSTEAGTQPYDTTTNILYPARDAARANWGGDWRMPTYAEISELYSATNLTWTWQSNYQSSGKKGYLVTSTNGNSIFLPAAGYFNGTSRYYAGAYGDYWSSTRNRNAARAYYLDFRSSRKGLYNDRRYYGYTVRPVR